jgi:hypothetical protein
LEIPVWRRSFALKFVILKQQGKLCDIWGIHGCDYEEGRLLGSQEAHCVSVAELSRLMLCKIVVFTAVNMKKTVFWDIKTQFVPHRRHVTPPLQRSAG